MLTDDQIVSLLSRNGTREDMLREAWRMGMRRAAEVCEEMTRCSMCDGQYVHDKCDPAPAYYEFADAIRAEAE